MREDRQPQTAELHSEAPPSCRPLEHWQATRRPAVPSPPSVQAVKLPEAAATIVGIAERYVQFLRVQKEPFAKRPRSVAWELCAALYARHPVHPDHWTGDGVPPSEVELLEWEWPADLRPVQILLRQLRSVCEPALSCLSAAVLGIGGSPQCPTEAEVEQAERELRARLAVVEPLVVSLRQELRDATRAKSHRETARTAETPPNQPRVEHERLVAKVNALPERARMAYRSYEFAEPRVSRQPGKSRVTDAQVHAWLKEHGYDDDYDYELPDLETWKRYLRDARREMGIQKNAPRHGRGGGSVRKADEL